MKININKSLAVSEWENETLEMTKVSRLDIAAFLCIASVSVAANEPLMTVINYFSSPCALLSPVSPLFQFRMEFLQVSRRE
jgi:hypothetical protein